MSAGQPTAEQLQALRSYATEHGRTWRAQLHAEWMNACQGIRDLEQQALLQQLRNQLGPAWLRSHGAAAVKPASLAETAASAEPPAKACPVCGAAMELVKASEGGMIGEVYFPKYPIRGAELPRRQRPASFWACACDHCEEVAS